MTATVIPFPTPADRPGTIQALTSILATHADSARALASDVRDLLGPYDPMHMQLARDLRRAARKVDAALDRGDLDVPGAFELLELTDPLIKRAHRLVITDDVRRAVEPELFARVEDWAVTIGELALVAFESFICGGIGGDLPQFIEDEALAEVPMMHVMQRVVARGFRAGLDASVRPAWLQEELSAQVRASLAGVHDMEARPIQMASPFGVAAVAALQVASDRWYGELDGELRDEQLRTYDGEARWVVDCLQRGPRQLQAAPSVADLWDLGHMAGQLQVLLDELAEHQRVEPVRNSNAVAWLQLLDPTASLDATAFGR